MLLTRLRLLVSLLGVGLAIAGAIAYSQPESPINSYKLSKTKEWSPVAQSVVSVGCVFLAEVLLLFPRLADKLPGFEVGLRATGGLLFFESIFTLIADVHFRRVFPDASFAPTAEPSDIAAPLLMIFGNLVGFIGLALLPDRVASTAQTPVMAAKSGPAGWVSIASFVLVIVGAIILFADDTVQVAGITKLGEVSVTRQFAVSGGLVAIAYILTWFWGYVFSSSDNDKESYVGSLVAVLSSFYLIRVIISVMLNFLMAKHYSVDIISSAQGSVKDTWVAGGAILWIGSTIAVLFGGLLAKGEMGMPQVPDGVKLFRPFLCVAGLVITISGVGVAGKNSVLSDGLVTAITFPDPSVWYGICMIITCVGMLLGLYTLRGKRQTFIVLAAACVGFTVFRHMVRSADMARRLNHEQDGYRGASDGLILQLLGVILVFLSSFRFEKILDNFREATAFKKVLNVLTILAFGVNFAGLVTWWQWLDDAIGENAQNVLSLDLSVDTTISIGSLLCMIAVFVALFVETGAFSSLFALWTVVPIFVNFLSLLIANNNDDLAAPFDADDRIGGLALCWIAAAFYLFRLMHEFVGTDNAPRDGDTTSLN